MEEIIANILLENQAVKIETENPFTWTSGIKSPIYCDNRLLISYPDAVNTIVLGFKEILEDMDFDVIAGTATAGIPWASFLAYELDKPLIYIRKKPKEHGTKSQIEGVMKAKQKVVLIEDLISTGGSSISALQAIQKEGGIADTVLAIFSYGFPLAQQNFSEADAQCKTLTSFPVLLDHLTGIKNEEKEDILNFSKDPQNWRS